jgi:hypothetical protein
VRVRVVDERSVARDPEHLDRVLDDSFPASDPPSWSGAISRPAGTAAGDRITEHLLRRMRAEFRAMPGLSLTLDQAQRLWSVDPRTCEALFDALIDSRFLRRTPRGRFVLIERDR